MALPEKIARLSEAEYLAFERASETKHEYANGNVYAMTGASWFHGVIIANLITTLNTQINQAGCIGIANDLRVRVATAKAFRYPDIVVICGEPQFMDKRVDTVLNPTMLIEVLSPSTELVDRNEKLREYRQIESLQIYLLVAQHEPRVERFVRQEANNWLYSDVTGLGSSLSLPSLSCTLALADVYRKVTFEEDNKE